MTPEDARAGEVVIDLGTDWAVPSAPRRRGRRLRHRPPVWLALALIVVFLLGAAEPVRRAGALVLPSHDLRATSLSMSHDLVFATTRRGEGASIRAYALADGRTRWTVDLPYPTMSTYPTDDGILLGIAEMGPPDQEVGAFDAETGVQLWWRAGLDFLDVAGDVALFTGGSNGQTDRLLALSLRTGRQLWERPATPDDSITLADRVTGHQGPARVVTAGPDGVVRVLDLAGGRVLAQTTVPVGGVGPRSGVQAATAGDHVFVRTGDPTAGQLIGYDLGLTRLWSFDGNDAPSPMYGCGPLLCAINEGAMYLLDPATGHPRWSGTGWRVAEFLGGDRLLAGGPYSDRVALLDADTGSILADLTGWQELTDSPPVFSRHDAGSASRTWFAMLDPGADRLRPLGSQDGVVEPGCSAVTGYIACPLDAGGLMILRITT